MPMTGIRLNVYKIYTNLLSCFLALTFTQLKFKDKNDMDRKYLDAVKGNNSSKFDENRMKR